MSAPQPLLTPDVLLFAAWMWRYLPLATFTTLPASPRGGTAQARSVALWHGDKRQLEQAVAFQAWAREQARLDLLGVAVRRAA